MVGAEFFRVTLSPHNPLPNDSADNGAHAVIQSQAHTLAATLAHQSPGQETLDII